MSRRTAQAVYETFGLIIDKELIVKPPFLRTAYNYDRDQASMESGLKCEDKTLAQQHFRDEVDINTLVDRFHLTGEMPQLNALPAYADYTGIFDFQSAMNAVRQANETFMQLPAELRARFHNSEQEFLAWADNKDNLAEAAKLGLLSDEALKRFTEANEKAEDERSAARAATRGPKPKDAPKGPDGPKT